MRPPCFSLPRLRGGPGWGTRALLLFEARTPPRRRGGKIAQRSGWGPLRESRAVDICARNRGEAPSPRPSPRKRGEGAEAPCRMQPAIPSRPVGNAGAPPSLRFHRHRALAGRKAPADAPPRRAQRRASRSCGSRRASGARGRRAPIRRRSRRRGSARHRAEGPCGSESACRRTAAARAKASITLLRVEACKRCSGASRTSSAP